MLNLTDSCTVPVKRALAEVIGQTPANKIAMFRVISIPSTVGDEVLGEAVYIKGRKVYDFMCDREIEGLQASDLLFLDYVER